MGEDGGGEDNGGEGNGDGDGGGEGEYTTAEVMAAVPIWMTVRPRAEEALSMVRPLR